MGRWSAGREKARNGTGRLFLQDRRIAWNVIRATFANWHDRAIAAFLLLAALAIAQAWFAERPPIVAAWVALAVGALSGVGAERLVAARLVFHASDGLLAADALDAGQRRRYRVAWHGIGLGVFVAVMLVVRASLSPLGGVGYIAGVLVAGAAGSMTMPERVAGMSRPGWTVRAWSHRPAAGGVAAAILLLSLLAARTLGIEARMVIVGAEVLLFSLLLAGVDDAVVRFMTFAGYDVWRIVARHARGLAGLFAVALPGCWAMVGPVAAGIGAAIGVAVLLLVTLRVLAYRLHARRFADVLVSLLAGLLMTVAYSLPVALPVIVVAMLWQLHRRGRARMWLLA
ncbi:MULTISPECIES: hypothetical protein [unclassified Sphingomonas]|uniref:hypothetical protein n=1 Tax=unclassified Sphingomonas TaxID=196159 RepID=UPI0009E66503|nr:MULTISPECIES: hypothetical protein [unclassified Sphingomonas]